MHLFFIHKECPRSISLLSLPFDEKDTISMTIFKASNTFDNTFDNRKESMFLTEGLINMTMVLSGEHTLTSNGSLIK